jgi:putative proteasome-type protease
VITLLKRDFDQGRGLASSPTMYDAVRAVGERVREVRQIDKAALEADEFRFNVHLLIGGQIKGEPPQLYLVYPQGNPLQATEESPFLQIGETKYGRPILDRGIRFERTSLEEACKYALLSMDSTMKSNVTVGPPVDLLAYSTDDLDITRQRRFGNDDPDLAKIRLRWEQALRQGVARLPDLRFRVRGGAGNRSGNASNGHVQDDSIQLIDSGSQDAAAAEAQAQAGRPTRKE